MKLLWIWLLLVFVSGCQKTISHKPIGGSAYFQVENTPFDRMIIKNQNAFDGYDKIIFSALKFDQFEVSPSRDHKIDKSWELDVSDKLEYAGYFKDELLGVFGGEHADELFGLGTGRNDSTLYAEVRLLRLNPLVAKHGEITSGTVSQKSVESFGALTVQIMLVDSLTNEFVAVIEDGKDLATGSSVRSAVNKATDAYVWKKTFQGWLSDLKDTAVMLKKTNPSVQ